MSYSTVCDGTTSARRGSIALGADGFNPGADIALEWAVTARGVYGTWEGVVASDKGVLSTEVDLPRNELAPGDSLEIWAQGPGPDGIAAVSKDIVIGDC